MRVPNPYCELCIFSSRCAWESGVVSRYFLDGGYFQPSQSPAIRAGTNAEAT